VEDRRRLVGPWTRVPASSSIDVEAFNQFFAEKVAKVRLLTSEAPPPTFSRVWTDASFPAFSPLTTDDVINAIKRLADKSSAADLFPTSVLQQVIDLLSPYITELFNRSLAVGRFHAVFRRL